MHSLASGLLPQQSLVVVEGCFFGFLEQAFDLEVVVDFEADLGRFISGQAARLLLDLYFALEQLCIFKFLVDVF